MAQEMREYMAKLGIHTVDELVGRSDLLVQKQYPAGTHESKIDVSNILTNPYAKEESDVKMHFVPEDVFDFKLDKTIDETVIIPEMKEALAKKQKKEIRINVSNLNRALGTLFGAEISGKAFINGVAGERFCVRNSGASVVVEGVGEHGCEYMTGGCAVILGEVGKNFAAGMSGGIAYVLDRENDLYTKLNKSLVGFGAVTKPEDVAQLKGLIEEHVAWTDSKLGKKILKNFDTCLPHFKKIVPHDYAKMLDSIAEFEAEGMSREEAQIEAFYANTRN